MRKIVSICMALSLCGLVGCVNFDEGIDYENITFESGEIKETVSETDINIEGTTEEGTTSYEDVLARLPYRVGVMISHDDDNNIIFSIDGINIDNNEPEYDIGMFVLINGIPQGFRSGNGDIQYLSSVHIDSSEQTDAIYTCEYNNVLESEKYICRKNWMLMPDTLITNQRSFNMGHLQTIGTFGVSDEIVCETTGNVDVAVKQGTKIKNEESQSMTNELLADAFKGDFFTSTVMERKNAVGEYMIELTPGINGSYIISFWGNGEPVKVGEHMFYQVDVAKGSKYQYTFELTEEFVNSVDNFYVIVCPTGMDGFMAKTATTIFVDEYRK